MLLNLVVYLVSLTATVSARATYPPGCSDATFPDDKECNAKNWYLGPAARDPCAPLGPYPVNVYLIELLKSINLL